MPPTIRIVEGDLLDQKVEVIVNAWNRNILPWWLLLPQGVSGAIKRWGGYEPFRELAKHGPIPLGGAVHTSAGKLPFKGIIHVVGINIFWFATEKSIRKSVRSALELATENDYRSIAFPLIGAGTGGFGPQKTTRMIQEEIEQSTFDGEVTIVKFKKFDPTPLNHFEVRDKIVSNLRKEGYPDIADSLISASFEGGTPLEVCCILWGKLKVIQKKRYDFTGETQRLIHILERDLDRKIHR